MISKFFITFNYFMLWLERMNPSHTPLVSVTFFLSNPFKLLGKIYIYNLDLDGIVAC